MALLDEFAAQRWLELPHQVPALHRRDAAEGRERVGEGGARREQDHGAGDELPPELRRRVRSGKRRELGRRSFCEHL